MADPWFRTIQRLRFCDNDAIGHLNNAVYATLMEAGRAELMLEVAPILSNVSPVLVRLEIDFKREVAWPGDVLVETAVTRFGNKSIGLQHRLSKGDVLAAEGVSVLVLLDRTTRQSVAVDAAMRDRLARWSLPGI